MKPVLLSGGNPQIAKADGDPPVQAYIAALPGWKRAAGKRLDALITRAVPGVKKAVKWNSPFYGVEGKGWFLSFHAFTKYMKVVFFQGTSLRPLPPVPSKSDGARYVHVHEDEEIDEAQLSAWVKQAAAIPGWDPSAPKAPKKPARGGWREETLERMRALIVDADPKMIEERKWKKPSNPAGVPVWSHDGIVCTGETYAKYVKLTFANGAEVPDPKGLFNASLEGNMRRAIDIREGDTIDARAFKALVKAAVARNRAEAAKKAKKTR